MSDDSELADLLGGAPKMPDPGFRIDVFALMAERAQRRAAHRRAFKTIALFALIGLIFPASQAAGFDWSQMQYMAAAAGVVAAAYLLAMATIHGPRSVLARSRHVFRA